MLTFIVLTNWERLLEGLFSLQCLLAPIARIPVGGQAESQLPSLIEHFAAEVQTIESTFCSFEQASSDHAWVGAVC